MPELEQLSIKINADSASASSAVIDLANDLSSLLPKLSSLEKMSFKNLTGLAGSFGTLANQVTRFSTALNGIDFRSIAGTKYKIDNVIDAQTVKLMQEFGIAGNDAYAKIRKGLASAAKYSDSYYNSLIKNASAQREAGVSGDVIVENLQKAETEGKTRVQQLVNTINNEMSKIGVGVYDEALASFKSYVDAINNSASKMVVGFGKSEYGDDWSSIRSSLGRNFTGSIPTDGTSFATIDSIKDEVTQLYPSLFDANDNLEEFFDKFQRNVKAARQQANALRNAVDLSGIDDSAIRSSISDSISNIDAQQQLFDLESGSGVDLSREGSELGNLKSAIQEVTNAVNAKTKAFENEATVARASISSEVSALTPLQTAISEVATRIAKMSNGDTSFSSNISGITSNISGVQDLTKAMAGLGEVKFDATGIQNLANAVAKLGRGTVTQAVANIKELQSGMGEFAAAMNNISFADVDTAGLTELSASISRLGGKTATQAATTNIQQLATALRGMMETLSTAPVVSQNVINMANSLANLASQGTKVSTASRGVVSGLTNFGNTANFAKKHAFSLASAFGKLYASYWVLFRAFRLIGSAVTLASDLVEVQNVVDTAFGDMAYKVEELADVSIEQFGMSELALKEYASTFQAMANAVGISSSAVGDANSYLNGATNGYIELSDSLADVSLNLTKLTADMASFYNVEQDAVAEDLQSIFTGTTLPLRQYGIDLTEATLSEWALKQGLDADIESMTQAEKVMLRYQYVLAHTTSSHGDFAKTANTWANQVRILSQQFRQFGSIVGTGIIAAFKPFLQALNTVMSKVIDFSETILNALGKIFGWEFEITGGGTTTDLGDTTSDISSSLADADDSSGGVSDGLSDAADSASDLEEQLSVLPFDKLNRLSDNLSSSGGSGNGGSGSGGSGSGGSGSGSGSDGNVDVAMSKNDTILKAFESSIDSLYDLGKYIGDALSSAMESIDWEAIYEKARNFGEGLAEFLNGLISPRLFYNLGKTIAGALNTVLEFLNSFGETFDWTNFGESIAAGINGFFENFNFKLLAKTINTWAHGLLDAMIAAVENIKWDKIGESIGEFLADLDFAGIAAKVGKLLWKAINAAFELYANMFSAAPLETALLTIVTSLKVVPTLMNSAFGSKIKATVEKLASAFKTFATNVKSGNGIISSASTTMASYMSTASRVALSIGTVTTEAGFMYTAFQSLRDGDYASFFSNLAGSILSAVTAYTSLTSLGVPPWISLAIVGITGFISAIAGIAPEVDNYLGSLSEAVAESQEASNTLRESAQGLEDAYEAASGTIADTVASAEVASGIADKIKALNDEESLTIEQQSQMQQYVSQLKAIYPDWGGEIDSVTGKLNMSNEELDAFIQTAQQAAYVAAYQEAYNDVIEESVQLLIDQAKAEMEYKDVLDEKNDIEAEAIAVQEAYDKEGRRITELIEKQGKATGLTADEEQELFDLQQRHASGMTKYGNKIVTVSEYTNKLTDATNVASDAYDDYKAAQDAASEATEELNTWNEATIQSFADLYGITFEEAEARLAGVESGLDSTTEATEEASVANGVLAESMGYVVDASGEVAEAYYNDADQIVDADNNVIETLNGNTTIMTEAEAERQAAYQKSYDEAYESLKGQLSLQDEYNAETSVDAQTMLDNLNKQSTAYANYSNNLTTLMTYLNSSTNANKDLFLQYLSELGTEGAAEVEAWVQGLQNGSVTIDDILAAFGNYEENTQLLSGQLAGMTSATDEELGNTTSTIEQNADEAGAVAQQGYTEAVDEAEGAITDGTADVATAASNMGKTVESAITSSVGSLRSTARQKAQLIAQSYASGLETGTTRVKTAGQSLIAVVKGIATSISSLSSNFSSAGTVLTSTLASAILTGRSSVYNAGSSLASSLNNGLSSASSSSINTARSIANSVVSAFSGMASSAYSYGRSAAQAMANGLRSVHIPTPHMNISGYSIRSVNGTSIKTPIYSVSWYAQGGLFDRPTVVGIGEDGDEAVLPLTNKKTMSRIAQAINEQSDGVGLSKTEMAQAVAQGVAMAMQTNGQQLNVTVYSELKTENDEVLARAVTRGQKKLDTRYNPVSAY